MGSTMETSLSTFFWGIYLVVHVSKSAIRVVTWPVWRDPFVALRLLFLDLGTYMSFYLFMMHY